jgi:hypothetical protein
MCSRSISASANTIDSVMATRPNTVKMASPAETVRFASASRCVAWYLATYRVSALWTPRSRSPM